MTTLKQYFTTIQYPQVTRIEIHIQRTKTKSTYIYEYDDFMCVLEGSMKDTQQLPINEPIQYAEIDIKSQYYIIVNVCMF